MIIQDREFLVPRFEALEQREVAALADEAGLKGFVHVVLRNGDMEISREAIGPNLITERGDAYYGERAAGIASPPGQVTGMKLGTDSATVAAKTGAGAALVAYLAGSHRAMDGGFPTSALSSGKRRINWRATWAAGVATSNDIEEAVIVIDTLADATSTAADTMARAILATVPKGVNDTLELSWSHDLLGA